MRLGDYQFDFYYCRHHPMFGARVKTKKPFQKLLAWPSGKEIRSRFLEISFYLFRREFYLQRMSTY